MAAIAIIPSSRYRQAFLAMLDDFDRNDPQNSQFYAAARTDFDAYVRSLLDEERGLNLADGWVPASTRWLLTGEGDIAGVARLRHRVDTHFLSNHGGHIGYDVAPRHRRRGYGHLALQTALIEAHGIGLPQVLLYTAADNVASRAVIERAGGQLEHTRFSEFWNEDICTYWIKVPDTSVQSPCVRDCCLDDELICVGCFRSFDEIREWGVADDSRRRSIVNNARKRRDDAGVGPASPVR